MPSTCIHMTPALRDNAPTQRTGVRSRNLTKEHQGDESRSSAAAPQASGGGAELKTKGRALKDLAPRLLAHNKALGVYPALACTEREEGNAYEEMRRLATAAQTSAPSRRPCSRSRSPSRGRRAQRKPVAGGPPATTP